MSTRPNLMAPEVIANPYPLFAELRRKSPVCQVDPGGLWAVSRYEDVTYVFKNPQLFSAEGLARALEPSWLQRNPLARSLPAIDPPDHTKLRALVNRAFGPAMLSQLEPWIRVTAEELAQSLIEQRTADFMSGFAVPLPAAVIGHLLGLDASLYTRLKSWSDDLVSISSTLESDTQKHEQIRRTAAEMESYLREELEQRRRAPGSDMISNLLQAKVDGKALTDEELMSFFFLLVVTGLETTANLLGSAALWLTEHPEMLERLRAQPALIPAFVEESLRYDSPALGAFRMTTQETLLAGVKIPPRSMLILLLNSAARDEEYVPEPERFLLDRPVQSLPFGHGLHFCLGAALARLEARLALEALLPRVRRLTRAPGPVEWNFNIQIRGLKRLSVEMVAA